MHRVIYICSKCSAYIYLLFCTKKAQSDNTVVHFRFCFMYTWRALYVLQIGTLFLCFLIGNIWSGGQNICNNVQYLGAHRFTRYLVQYSITCNLQIIFSYTMLTSLSYLLELTSILEHLQYTVEERLPF